MPRDSTSTTCLVCTEREGVYITIDPTATTGANGSLYLWACARPHAEDFRLCLQCVDRLVNRGPTPNPPCPLCRAVLVGSAPPVPSEDPAANARAREIARSKLKSALDYLCEPDVHAQLTHPEWDQSWVIPFLRAELAADGPNLVAVGTCAFSLWDAMHSYVHHSKNGYNRRKRAEYERKCEVAANVLRELFLAQA